MAKQPVTVEVVGIAETMAALVDMEKQVRKKILKQAARKTMAPIAKSAKGRVPRRTGALRKSLGIKQKTYKNGVVVTLVGARKGFDTTMTVKNRNGESVTVAVKPSRYAHLVEFGDADTQAQPYLRPAWDAAKGSVPGVLANEIFAGIKRTKAGKMLKHG